MWLSHDSMWLSCAATGREKVPGAPGFNYSITPFVCLVLWALWLLLRQWWLVALPRLHRWKTASFDSAAWETARDGNQEMQNLCRDGMCWGFYFILFTEHTLFKLLLYCRELFHARCAPLLIPSERSSSCKNHHRLLLKKLKKRKSLEWECLPVTANV